MALPSSGGHAACSLWVVETLVIERRFFTPTICFQACCEQKPVGRYAQCGVMMGAAPPATLIMGETELLFEFLIIPLNGAAHHRRTHQGSTRHRDRETSEPIMYGLKPLSGPVGQQPLFLAGGAHRCQSRCAAGTGSAAKREESLAFVPGRHVTVRQALGGS